VASRWRPGEGSDPPTPHGWLARYVRGPLAPTLEDRRRPHGFSPSGLRYSAIYGSLLVPEVGLRIDSVFMRHCPTCQRWLRTDERACPADAAHGVGWRLRQHRMLDARPDALLGQLDHQQAFAGALRPEGVGTDGAVVSGRRLHRCGNRACTYYVLDPGSNCGVCGTPPPHGRASSHPALGPLPVDVESLGVEAHLLSTTGGATDASELLLDCQRLMRDLTVRPAILRCVAWAMHGVLAEAEAGAPWSGDGREMVKHLSDRLPTRPGDEELEEWVRRLQALLGYRAGGHGELEEEESAHG
jgi:hypothetical protein